MILDDNEIEERMESPINLINRLRSSMTSARSKSHPEIPMLPPSAKDIIPDLDEKIDIGSLKSKASNILVKAMKEIDAKISDTTKMTDLTKVAAEMNKIIIAETENKSDAQRPQFIVFAPGFQAENKYETIQARGE